MQLQQQKVEILVDVLLVRISFSWRRVAEEGEGMWREFVQSPSIGKNVGKLFHLRGVGVLQLKD